MRAVLHPDPLVPRLRLADGTDVSWPQAQALGAVMVGPHGGRVDPSRWADPVAELDGPTLHLYPRLSDPACPAWMPGATWDGRCWSASAYEVAQSHPPAWIVELVGEPEPTLLFDHTLDGLRGIELVDIPGIKPRTVEALGRVGLESAFDVLHCLPHRYLDMSQPSLWGETTPGSEAAVLGTVCAIVNPPGKKFFKLVIVDAAGAKGSATWFNVPYHVRSIKKGQRVVVLGKADEFRGEPTITSPIVECIDDDTEAGGILGVYPASATNKLSTWQVLAAATSTLKAVGELVDPVPGELLNRRALVSRTQAFRMAHTPQCLDDATSGRDRLAYDELLRLQMVLATARAARSREAAWSHRPRAGLLDRFLDNLPYRPTGAQTRALGEIVADMTADTAMERLLQGDVGAGKTLVCCGALLTAVDSGFQAAMLAPTEILATQHFVEMSAMLTPLGVKVALLTNKVTGKAKKAVLAGLASGDIDIVVGTHAVLGAEVSFASLSAVVVDEQHRFGVEQRAALSRRSHRRPDMLYASATPIPRTAAMTVFGDLEVSTLDEMPPGRSPVQTFHLAGTDLSDSDAQPWQAVRAELEAGRQAFVVTPLVSASLTREDKAAHESAAALSAGALSGFRVGVVTGKDKPDVREATMADFAAGRIDVLVATTVIEVGVNVPNATAMVVLGADKFGLAQLHQLRGRVGRGAYRGLCFLVAETKTATAAERMQAMCQTTDGFVLAERDLAMRGAGTLTSSRQSGRGRDLRVASVLDDRELLEWAKADARTLVGNDPTLARLPSLRAEVFAAIDDASQAQLLSA